MKKLFAFAVLSAFLTLSYAQKEELFYAKVKKEELPASLVTAIENDFPGGSITELKALPVEIIDQHWFVGVNRNTTGQNFDTYVITINTRKGRVHATYDAQGKLIYTTESLKDVALPVPLRKTIGRDFPGWAVAGDKELVTHFVDGKQKTHYIVDLSKDGKTDHITLDGSGNLIKSRLHPKHVEKMGKHKAMKKQKG